MVVDEYVKIVEEQNEKLSQLIETNRKISDIWIPKWVHRVNNNKRKNKEYIAYMCLADGREVVKILKDRNKYVAEKIDGNYIVPICHKNTVEECIKFVEEYYGMIQYPYCSSYREEDIKFYQPKQNECI
jgi:hypothetical protein